MVGTVLIIDDHDIVRFGLETLVLACPDLKLVGSAGSLADGLRLIAQHQPDVVVSDMSVGDSSGLDTVRAVVAAQEGRATLIVSMQDELLYGEQALSLGASGYVMKDNAHAAIVPAIRSVLAGENWASPRLQARLVNRLLRRRADPASSSADEPLTLRELEVLEQLKSGKTTKEIATALELSVRTVDLHRSNIKRKLRLRTGAELIAYASHHL